jgi:hypothetical protein
MAGITDRDFVALHSLLDVDHLDDPGPGMPWQLMANLQELFHSDYVTFDRTWTSAQQFVFEQTLGIYERLGVTSRTAAVTKMSSSGLE